MRIKLNIGMINLLIHHWKEKQRSFFWKKSIILNIVFGIVGFYILLNVFVIGFFSDQIILKLYKNKDLLETYTGLLFYYFSLDLIIRFLYQKLPTISIQPYLTLPIKKSTLLHYPLLKSGLSFFNIVAILFFIPFFIKVVCTTHPFLFCITWFTTLLSLIIINNFLNFSFKKYFTKYPLLILFLLTIVGVLIFLDKTKNVSCTAYFSNTILIIANTPFLVIIPIVLSFLTYYMAYFLLKKNSYIEDTYRNNRIKTDSFLFLKQFGEIGDLLRIEIKMILRNKRPKSMFYMSILFLFYGFIFYQNKTLDNYMILIFTGLFLPSLFAINHGQFFFSWESSFFDSYLTNKIAIFNYIKSKYLFYLILSLLGYVLTLPYAIISYKIGIINGAILLFNIGISSIIIIFFCTYNAERINLGKSQFMNYEGTGLGQFLLLVPIIGIPMLIYYIFKIFNIPQYTYYALGGIGIIGIAFNKYLLQILIKQFKKRKYKMALGFRQK